MSIMGVAPMICILQKNSKQHIQGDTVSSGTAGSSGGNLCHLSPFSKSKVVFTGAILVQQLQNRIFHTNVIEYN